MTHGVVDLIYNAIKSDVALRPAEQSVTIVSKSGAGPRARVINVSLPQGPVIAKIGTPIGDQYCLAGVHENNVITFNTPEANLPAPGSQVSLGVFRFATAGYGLHLPQDNLFQRHVAARQGTGILFVDILIPETKIAANGMTGYSTTAYRPLPVSSMVAIRMRTESTDDGIHFLGAAVEYVCACITKSQRDHWAGYHFDPEDGMSVSYTAIGSQPSGESPEGNLAFVAATVKFDVLSVPR